MNKNNKKKQNDHQLLFLPSIFTDGLLNFNIDPKNYLSKVQKQDPMKQRSHSTNNNDQKSKFKCKLPYSPKTFRVNFKQEQDQSILYAFEDKFQYSNNFNFNNSGIVSDSRQTEKQVKQQQLNEIYKQKMSKKSSLRQYSLNRYKIQRLDINYYI